MILQRDISFSSQHGTGLVFYFSSSVSRSLFIVANSRVLHGSRGSGGDSRPSLSPFSPFPACGADFPRFFFASSAAFSGTPSAGETLTREKKNSQLINLVQSIRFTHLFLELLPAIFLPFAYFPFFPEEEDALGAGAGSLVSR